jgi:hypothetical protein
VRVEYVQRTDEVDVATCCGRAASDAVPEGLPVARVTRVARREFGIYQEVEAEPT